MTPSRYNDGVLLDLVKAVGDWVNSTTVNSTTVNSTTVNSTTVNSTSSIL